MRVRGGVIWHRWFCSTWHNRVIFSVAAVPRASCQRSSQTAAVHATLLGNQCCQRRLDVRGKRFSCRIHIHRSCVNPGEAYG